MKKKVLSLLLTLVLVLGCLPMAASAASTPTSGNCGAVGNETGVTWKIENGTLTISGSGAMADYFGVVSEGGPAPWYSSNGSITKVVVEEGVTTIGNYAFEDCKGPTSVNLPDSVTSIGDGVFLRCIGLKSVNIPNSVTSIGSYAFEDCEGLTSLAIPDNVTSIGYGAFSDCHKLTEITVGTQNNNYVSEDGVLFNKDKTKLIFCPVNKSGAYEIPASVTSIGEYAFENCKSLTSVVFPDGVTTIGNYAFEECKSLTSANLPDGVTSIGDSAFLRCTGLKSVNLPDSVTSIGDGAFYECSSLKSITLPTGLTSIEGGSFSFCSGLTSITIPVGVTSIGGSAFLGCSNLTSVTFPDGLTSMGGSAFGECTNLKSVTFPASLTTLGSSAFAIPGMQTAIFMGDAPAFIGDYAVFAPKVCIYYADGAKGWTTPTWNGNREGKEIYYSCKPLSQMKPDKPNTPSTPSTPSEDEPIVETSTTESGNLVTTTTQPNGDKERKVETLTGETIANIKLPADPGKGKEFADVKSGAWYEGAVDKATAYGLFGGTSETTFAPGAEMTRGMLAQVLYNLSGKARYGVGEGTFTDVKNGAWYANAVDWAAKVGVTSGTGNGGFSPNQSITREQLVTMLYNYAKAIGMDTTESTQIDSFPDGEQVNDWAQIPMQWAVAKGFISGRADNGENYIAPQDTATRAEVAAVLVKFTEKLK